MQAKELLIELLNRKSVTPDDAGCQKIIIQLLESFGFVCQTIQFGEVTNLWAVHGNKRPLTVFAGHTDVVPAGDLSRWETEPFVATEKDGYIYGRGAADMKSGVATMCIAAIEFIQENPDYQGSVAIMLTSDEEGPAQDGIKRLMPHLIEQGIKMDYAVFTEPSSVNVLGDMIKNGRRGSMHAYLRLQGKQGHIAYPDKVLNPNHIAGEMITRLTAEDWCQGNEFFQPTSMQIWGIESSSQVDNIVPSYVDINFNFRFSSELTSDVIKNRVTKIVEDQLNQINKDGRNYSYQLNFHVSGEPFLTERGRLVDAMETACFEVVGVKPELSTSGGTSDARFVAPYQVEVVEFGPINKTIHQVNECVKVSDIEPTKNILKQLLVKLYA